MSKKTLNTKEQKTTEQTQDEKDLKKCLSIIEQACSDYNCQISVARKIMYGQPVFVPVVENKPKNT